MNNDMASTVAAVLMADSSYFPPDLVFVVALFVGPAIGGRLAYLANKRKKYYGHAPWNLYPALWFLWAAPGVVLWFMSTIMVVLFFITASKQQDIQDRPIDDDQLSGVYPPAP